MRAHYRDMLTELSGIMNEQVSLGNECCCCCCWCFFCSCVTYWASSFFCITVLHYSCISSFFLHTSLFFLLNLSFHYSCKKVFLLPALHLSLTALCPLCLRPVCHVIKSPQKGFMSRWYLLFSAYPTAKSANLDTYHLLNFPAPVHCFNSLSPIQIPHTRQPGTERHSAYWMASRLTRIPLC